MLRNFLFILLGFSLVSGLACSSSAPPANVNANVGNVVNLDPAKLPPGFSASPLPMGTNSTPGIPGPNDANTVTNGKIPGIPDTNKMGKTPQPKNTPRIPGIPDEETLRKQMNTPLKDVNIVNNPPANQRPDNRPADKSRGNLRQP